MEVLVEDELGLEEGFTVAAMESLKDLTSVKGFREEVGADSSVLELAAVYFGGRRRLGVPLTAGFLLNRADLSISKSDFVGLVSFFRESLGWSRCFFGAESFAGFYNGFLEDYSFCEVSEVCGVSRSVLSKAVKELCSCFGVDRSLSDPVLRPETFGFSESERCVEGFACFLVGEMGEPGVFRGARVWGAAALVVSGKVI